MGAAGYTHSIACTLTLVADVQAANLGVQVRRLGAAPHLSVAHIHRCDAVQQIELPSLREICTSSLTVCFISSSTLLLARHQVVRRHVLPCLHILDQHLLVARNHHLRVATKHPPRSRSAGCSVESGGYRSRPAFAHP